MAEVFGETHRGYVQPSDNLFANCSDSEEEPVGICSDDSEDPFGDESSSDLSAGSFSDLSSIYSTFRCQRLGACVDYV